MRISDWSSDVCSSDLPTAQVYKGASERTTDMYIHNLLTPQKRAWRGMAGAGLAPGTRRKQQALAFRGQRLRNKEGLFPSVFPALSDRKSVVSGQGVAVRVAHGGRRSIRKNKYV